MSTESEHERRNAIHDGLDAWAGIEAQPQPRWMPKGMLPFWTILIPIALLIVGIAMLVYAATAQAATGLGPNVKAIVGSVHDGDTIRVYSGSRIFSIRVVGIDTPEVAPVTPECFGAEAQTAARHLLYPGRPVWIQTDAAAGDHDRYGRKLRIVRLYAGRRPGRTFERWLLVRGLANEYDYRRQALALKSTWKAQRDAALKAKRGAWGSCPGPSGNGPTTNIYRAWSTGPVPTPISAPVAQEPSIGALPATGINDLTAATNHPDLFWGDYHALHMSWVRIVADWHVLQPSSDAPDYTTTAWRVTDAFMTRAHAEGARVLVSFGGIPAWARLHAVAENLGSGARPAAYADWVRLWVARYPQMISAVDQHEANCCSLSEYVATKDLARMLDASYPILHAAGVLSVAGSWTEGGVSGARQRQAIQDLGVIYKGRAPAFDALGFHFYPSLWARRVGVELADPAPTDSYLMTEFGRLQHDIDAAFPGRRMRWMITETGWSTPGGYHGDALTGDQQAAAAMWELREASRFTPRLAGFFWFLDVDQSTNEATRNIYKSGLHEDDGAAKPILSAWTKAAS
jgi:endonuclease YncB( thermonuclease family)